MLPTLPMSCMAAIIIGLLTSGSSTLTNSNALLCRSRLKKVGTCNDNKPAGTFRLCIVRRLYLRRPPDCDGRVEGKKGAVVQATAICDRDKRRSRKSEPPVAFKEKGRRQVMDGRI